MPISTRTPGQGRRRARRAAVLLAPVLAVLCVAACSAPDPAPTVASLPSASGAPSSPAGSGSGPSASGPSGSSSSATQPSGSPASTSPASSAGQPDAAAGRPQFRLDDTDERRTALVNAYSQCLLDHGATKGEGRAAAAAAAGDGGTGTPLLVVADPVPAAASAACAGQLPLLPPETEAATNPDFHAQSQAYVACMRDRGLWVQLLDNHDLDWTYVDGHPVPADGAQIEHDCLLEAFS